MHTVFCDSQGVLLVHLNKLRENVNSASNCEVLLKLQDSIRRKRPGQLARGVLLHHDKVRPHTARATQHGIQELQWELLEKPPYSPHLVPSDFHLVGTLKTTLMANVSLMKMLKRRCGSGEATVKNFYAASFDALVERWDRCVNVNGGYVKKYVLFSRFRYHMFYVLYPCVNYLLTLPRMSDVMCCARHHCSKRYFASS
jgi:hypothetical protein